MSEPAGDRVQNLFDQAVALPPAQRAAFLEAACAGDSTLRAELESLLACDADFPEGATEGLLGSPLVRPAQAAAPSVEEKPPAIPGYDLGGLLGRGGMGVVYRARDVALKRTVALKVILAGGHAGPAERARFQAEAEAVARLQHPNVVQVYEVGSHEGQPYLALEYVDGGTLAQKLKGGPLPPRAAAALVATLARAVAVAHNRDVIHRDLKPANVLLTQDGTPKVTDFGLAKRLDAAPDLTNTGAVMGTPSYLAPEQATGDSRAVGPAADVYSLGAILYECLTGRPPFQGANAVETLDHVRRREPTPARAHDRRIPHDLETICLKCLRKDPQKRYASAEDLAEDLRRWQGGEPIMARPVRAWERALSWTRRNPVAAALLAAVALIVVVGAAAVYFAEQTRRQAGRASQQEDRADQEAEARRLLAAQEEEARRAVVEKEKAALLESRRADAVRHARHIDLALRAWRQNDLVEAERLLSETQPAFAQTWETRHVRHLCARKAPALSGHTGAVAGVALSDDGTRIASGSLDGTVRLWDADTGRELRTLRGHEGEVRAVAFRPDGQRLVSGGGKGGKSGEVKVWDLAAGKELFSLRGHKDTVYTVDFSPDGKKIVSAGQDRTVKVWDASTGNLERTLTGHKTVVFACFCKNGQRIASASMDQVLKIWDAGTGKPLATLKGYYLSIASMTFGRDDPRLLAVGPKNTLVVCDPDTGKEQLRLQGDVDSVQCVVAGPEDQWTVAGTAGSAVRVWDGRTGKVQATLQGHTKPVMRAVLSRDGRRVVSGGFDGTLRVWRWAEPQEKGTLSKGMTISALSFSGDRRLLVVGSDRAVKVWDLATAAVTRALPGLRRQEAAVALSRDGGRLVYGGRYGPLVVTDAADGRALHSLAGHQAAVNAAAFSRDGRWVVSCGVDHAVKIHDAGTGQEVRTLRGHTERVHSVAFSNDARWVASSDAEAIKLWEAATGKEVRTIRLPGGGQGAVAFSPDDRFLAVADRGSTVTVWRVETGQLALTLAGHADWVKQAAFSPDGQRIATASADRTVKFWDAVTGQEMLTLLGHAGSVDSLAFSPNGQWLASASLDGEVKLWEAGPPAAR